MHGNKFRLNTFVCIVALFAANTTSFVLCPNVFGGSQSKTSKNSANGKAMKKL